MEGKNKKDSDLVKDQGKNMLIVFLILLILISGIKLYTDHQNQHKKEVDLQALSTENTKLNERIDSLTQELNIRIQEIKKLGGNITALELLRDQLLSEKATTQQRTAQEIAQLSKKLQAYQTFILEKDEEIELLEALNLQLTSENQDLKRSRKEVLEEINRLFNKQKQLEAKIDEAEKLRAENILVTAINKRGRERVESQKDFKTRQIDELKINFNFSKNSLAKDGRRVLSAQVLTSDNTPVLSGSTNDTLVLATGIEVSIATQKAVFFNNSGETQTLLLNNAHELGSGLYFVRIFVDNYEAGTTSFSVK